MARLNHVNKFRGTSKTEDGSLECERCEAKIVKGDSYLWWANKIGRMSVKHVRCSKPECRPKSWEYSTTSPHIKGLMQAEESGQLSVSQVKFGGRDDVDSFREELASTVHDVASEVTEVAEGYEEGASNMEDGFGHTTYQSEELTAKGEELRGQAEELESFEVGEAPEADDELESWVEDARSEADEAIQEGCQAP